MSRQQNFNEPVSSVLLSLRGVLDAQPNVPGINDFSWLPNFSYGSQRTGGGTQMRNDMPYSDHHPLRPSSPVMGSGNSINSLPQPTPDQFLINEVIMQLNSMRDVLHKTLREIEDLVHRMHVSLPRSNSSVPPTINFPSLSHYNHDLYQFDLNEPGKHLSDAIDYNLPSTSSGVPGTVTSLIEPRTGAPAADSTFGFCMDSDNVSPNSPIYELIVDEGVRCFRCACGHRTKNRGDMTRHLKCLKHSGRSYICECGESYTRNDGLKRHQRICERKKRG